MKLAELKITFTTNATLTEAQLDALAEKATNALDNLTTYANQLANELPYNVRAEVQD